MRPINRGEETQCRVIMTRVFPGTDLVVISQVFNRDQYGESLVIQGSEEPLEALYPHLRSLLNRGCSFYFWSGVRRSQTNPRRILLHLEETGRRKIPRLELVEHTFRADVVNHCDLLLSPHSVIEVVSPWGHFIDKQTVGLPSDRNGTIPIVPLQ